MVCSSSLLGMFLHALLFLASARAVNLGSPIHSAELKTFLGIRLQDRSISKEFYTVTILKFYFGFHENCLNFMCTTFLSLF